MSRESGGRMDQLCQRGGWGETLVGWALKPIEEFGLVLLGFGPR